LCALSLAFAVAGCSQNVGTEDDAPLAKAPAAETPAQAATPAPAPTVAAPAPTAAPMAAPIQWETTFDGALAKARATQKPIMIDFYATWCGPCKVLDQQIYPAPEVTVEAQNFVSLKIDVDQQPDLATKFAVKGLPSIVFLNASGQEVHRETGITGQVGDFVRTMQTARSLVAPTPA